MKKTPRFELFILILVFILGILLRLHAYLFHNIFFGDEDYSLMILQTTRYINLALPLSISQAEPFLFLMMSKFLMKTFGMNELALRAIPFVSSVASLFAFYYLSKKNFVRFWIRVLALLLFAVNFVLLYYAQFFRPYSSDVLLCILTLIVALSIDIKKINFKQAFGLGVLSSLAFCFSFPMLFSVSGIVLVYLCFSKEFKKILLFVLPNLITLIIYFFVSLKGTKSDFILNEFWAYSFNVFDLNLHLSNYDFLFTFMNYPQLFAILYVTGIVWLFKCDKLKTLILLSPIIMTLVAAYFKLYPFAIRLILFLIPILIIFILIPLDKIKLEKKPFMVILVTFYLAFLSMYFINFSRSFLFQLNILKNPDIITVLDILKKEKKPQDFLYVSTIPSYSYLYEDLFFKLPANGNAAMVVTDKIPQIDFLKMKKIKHIWILFVVDPTFYDKQLQDYFDSLYKHTKVLKDINTKSARLIEISLE